MSVYHFNYIPAAPSMLCCYAIKYIILKTGTELSGIFQRQAAQTLTWCHILFLDFCRELTISHQNDYPPHSLHRHSVIRYSARLGRVCSSLIHAEYKKFLVTYLSKVKCPVSSVLRDSLIFSRRAKMSIRLTRFSSMSFILRRAPRDSPKPSTKYKVRYLAEFCVCFLSSPKIVGHLFTVGQTKFRIWSR